MLPAPTKICEMSGSKGVLSVGQRNFSCSLSLHRRWARVRASIVCKAKQLAFGLTRTWSLNMQGLCRVRTGSRWWGAMSTCRQESFHPQVEPRLGLMLGAAYRTMEANSALRCRGPRLWVVRSILACWPCYGQPIAAACAKVSGWVLGGVGHRLHPKYGNSGRKSELYEFANEKIVRHDLHH